MFGYHKRAHLLARQREGREGGGSDLLSALLEGRRRRHHHTEEGLEEGRGRGHRGRGRLLGHGDLKLLLLGLIEQQPRHGYELIRTIEDLFHGHYSPSPGAIYPTLTMLEEMGLVAVASEQGGRKLYAITDEGRRFVAEKRAEVDAIGDRSRETARMLRKMDAPENVRKGMRSLKQALMTRSEWSAAEAKRVAAILERAAREIADDTPAGD